jgi:hypothetical protein
MPIAMPANAFLIMFVSLVFLNVVERARIAASAIAGHYRHINVIRKHTFLPAGVLFFDSAASTGGMRHAGSARQRDIDRGDKHERHQLHAWRTALA